MNVSLTILLDWSTKSADQSVRDLLDTVTVDCYGREHDTNDKVWILQGTTTKSASGFMMALGGCMADDDISHISMSRATV